MAPLRSGFVPAAALQSGTGSETVDDLIGFLQQQLVLTSLIIITGVIIGVFVGRLTRRLLDRVGVDKTVEGTSFERTAQGFGTSTISLVSAFVSLIIVGVSILFAVSVADVSTTAAFWGSVAVFIPKLLVGIFVLIVGTVAGDKAALATSERLKGIKLPEISLVPVFVKYSIFYIASLIALSQVGVATSALIVLLSAYLFGVVFLGGLAFKDLLTSAGAGVFLLLNQPYGIGDEVIIDDYEGIVQELTVFVTRIENDGTEYIIPNRQALQSGVVRERRD
jgi:small-conductance mechanosensitive channel